MEKIKNFFKHPILTIRSNKEDRVGVKASRDFALKLFNENKNGSDLARSKLLKAASLGDKTAIITIAKCYNEGLYGFRKNSGDALNWLGVIVKEDNNFSQFDLITSKHSIRCNEKPSNIELVTAMGSYIQILEEKRKEGKLKEYGENLINLMKNRIKELNKEINNISNKIKTGNPKTQNINNNNNNLNNINNEEETILEENKEEEIFSFSEEYNDNEEEKEKEKSSEKEYLNLDNITEYNNVLEENKNVQKNINEIIDIMSKPINEPEVTDEEFKKLG